MTANTSPLDWFGMHGQALTHPAKRRRAQRARGGVAGAARSASEGRRVKCGASRRASILGAAWSVANDRGCEGPERCTRSATAFTGMKAGLLFAQAAKGLLMWTGQME